MIYTLLSIAVGSVLGAWLRWYAGIKLNALFPDIPLGTLLVNLVGGFVIGFAISFFASANLSANYRLLVITGFCGGLTTFSTFSAEIVALIQQGKLMLALAAVLLHVVGTVLMTFCGIAVHQWLRT